MENDKFRSLRLVSKENESTIVVNASLFGRESPVFKQMFDGPMSYREAIVELESHDVFMKLVGFIQDGRLVENTDVFQLLCMADRFEVQSCIDYCVGWLRDPSNFNLLEAQTILELPVDTFVNPFLKNFELLAEKFIRHNFQDLEKLENEADEISLQGLKVGLGSDTLKAPSEDDVYEFVRRYSHQNYPGPKARMEFIAEHLAGYIRYPFLTLGKLVEFLRSRDFPADFAAFECREALLFKSKTLHERNLMAADIIANKNRKYTPRPYTKRLLQLVEMELPEPASIVYMHLTVAECVSLFPTGEIRSEDFKLADKSFYLCAMATPDGNDTLHLNLFVGMHKPKPLEVRFDFSYKRNGSVVYSTLRSGTYHFDEYNTLVGTDDNPLESISLDAINSEDGPFFNNGIMELRVQLMRMGRLGKKRKRGWKSLTT